MSNRQDKRRRERMNDDRKKRKAKRREKRVKSAAEYEQLRRRINAPRPPVPDVVRRQQVEVRKSWRGLARLLGRINPFKRKKR